MFPVKLRLPVEVLLDRTRLGDGAFDLPQRFAESHTAAETRTHRQTPGKEAEGIFEVFIFPALFDVTHYEFLPIEQPPQHDLPGGEKQVRHAHFMTPRYLGQ